MNGVLLVLIILVIAAIGVGRVRLLEGVGQAQRGLAGRREGRRPSAHRTARRSGAQPHRHRRRLQAGHGRRVRAVHRRLRRRSTRPPPRGRPQLAKESAIEGLYYVRAARTAMGMDPGPELESLSGPAVGGHRDRGPAHQLRGPRDRGVADTVAAHPELLPRRPRRGPPGARRLVFGAVVETGACGRRVGSRLGAAVRRDVLRDARSRLRRTGFRERLRRRLRGRLRSRTGYGGDGGDGGGWDGGGGGGGDGGGWDGGGWDGGGGDFGGGDFGGGDFGGF